DNLAGCALYQQTVSALQVVLKLAKDGLLPGRVEDEVPSARLCRNDAMKFGRSVALGNFDGRNHVVADDGRSVGSNHASPVIDHDQCRVDADRGKHGGKERGLVLAIA